MELYVFLFTFVLVVFGQCPSVKYSFDPSATVGNPLRGFFSFYEDSSEFDLDAHFPSSMMYSSIPLRDVMTGPNTFDWAKLEKTLNDCEKLKKQAVIRFYLDSPDSPTGVPDFLVRNCSDDCVRLTYYPYYNGGQYPDYTNPALIEALEEFIHAFGAKYDGDKRLAFIELGLLGFWGAWHTYPANELMAPTNIRKRVLDSYTKAFNKTFMTVGAAQLGYNETDDLFNYPMVGWHNDAFSTDTCGNYEYNFKSRLHRQNALNHSINAPFGGEVLLEAQPFVLSSDEIAQNFSECISEVKVSWLLYFNLFEDGFNEVAINRASKVMESMGYQFSATQIVITEPEICNKSTKRKCGMLHVSAANIGNAPFYYDAYIEAQIGKSAYIGNESMKVLLPGGLSQNFSVPISWIGSQDAIVYVRIVSPSTLIPIKWAVSGNQSDGSIVITIPSTSICGTVGNGVETDTEDEPTVTEDIQSMASPRTNILVYFLHLLLVCFLL